MSKPIERTRVDDKACFVVPDEPEVADTRELLAGYHKHAPKQLKLMVKAFMAMKAAERDELAAFILFGLMNEASQRRAFQEMMQLAQFQGVRQ